MKCQYCSECEPMKGYEVCEDCAEILYQMDAEREELVQRLLEEEMMERYNGYID